MRQTTLTGDPSLVSGCLDHLPVNPLNLLNQWFSEADRLKIVEPRGMILSTVNPLGHPSSRVILLKEIDSTGIVFASSGLSQKARDLAQNPLAAGTIWWRETMQQINIQGYVQTLPAAKSDALFHQRARDAQAVATLVHPSAPLLDAKPLREAAHNLVNQPGDIPRPDTWHGYHLTITAIEFWLGSHDRFHHRVKYEFKKEMWKQQRLQP